MSSGVAAGGAVPAQGLRSPLGQATYMAEQGHERRSAPVIGAVLGGQINPHF